MKNSIPSASTAAQKSTTVETQDSSSHINGNTYVAYSFSSTVTKNDYENVEQNFKSIICQLKAAYDSSGKTS